MSYLKVSLDQWRLLQAVVDHGGYAQAAEALHKSQSTVSYGVHRLEERLDVKVLEVHGRKAVLTDAGAELLRRARSLLDDAYHLEQAASQLRAGWEAEIRLCVDVIFPPDLLLTAMRDFSEVCQHTRLELYETVLSGGVDAIVRGDADMAITGLTPQGFLSEPLLEVEFVAVAAPSHPLHHQSTSIGERDLRPHRQIVVRDSGAERKTNSGWLGAMQRWTVSTFATSVQLLEAGLGFAWVPRHLIADQLKDGRLRPLSLDVGTTRTAQLFLVFADRDHAGPALQHLAKLLRERSTHNGAANPGPVLAGRKHPG